MTLREEIAALQARIAKAESERDTWRTSGIQENYLEAYSRVEALELQLERLRQQGLRSLARNRAPDPVSVMAELSIAYDGRHYQYDRYRYDRLADAVSYARLQRSRPPAGEGSASMPPAQLVQAPDESERHLMAALAITFRDGVYHLGAYRYDRLGDAVSYARRQRPEEGRP